MPRGSNKSEAAGMPRDRMVVVKYMHIATTIMREKLDLAISMFGDGKGLIASVDNIGGLMR